MPSDRRLLDILQQPVGEEEASGSRGVLPGDRLHDGAILEVQPTDRTIQTGYVHPKVREIERDLIVPRRRGGRKDGVIDGLSELPGEVRVHIEGPGDRTHAQQRRRLRVVTVHPAEVKL